MPSSEVKFAYPPKYLRLTPNLPEPPKGKTRIPILCGPSLHVHQSLHFSLLLFQARLFCSPVHSFGSFLLCTQQLDPTWSFLSHDHIQVPPSHPNHHLIRTRSIQRPIRTARDQDSLATPLFPLLSIHDWQLSPAWNLNAPPTAVSSLGKSSRDPPKYSISRNWILTQHSPS